jgi:hypothetical protein
MSEVCSANLSDLTAGYAQSLTCRAEVQARLQDFLARKKLAIGESMEGILRRVTALHRDRLKSSLESVLLRFGRLRRESVKPAGEWEALMERIRSAGREGTIETYPEYLF